MQGYSHLIIGLGVGLTMENAFGTLGIAMTCLGSLLPDIDHPKSILGKRFPLGAILGVRHRGWIHSLLGLAVFVSITALISIALVPGIALGYVSHLLADSLTPSGIAWFYPLSKTHRHIIGIHTGSAAEYAIDFIIVCFIAISLI